ncbi:MAG: lipoprotein-releasing ABC transporter permease subunit [Acidiferrobacterales bacterium]|nr:lipoprotein-releasing ABC transporter permease subunit [Acidiferrobacterales bacterium]
MIRPLELYVGLRYMRARRSNHFVSFISLMATMGIVLGVAALIVVLSVMNGFGTELRGRILDVVSHVTIAEGWSGLRDWEQADRIVSAQPHVLATAPYIEGQGMLLRGRSASGVAVRGVLPEREQSVSEIASKIQAGRLSALTSDGKGIILGTALAKKIGVKPGDHLALVAQKGGSEQLSPNLLRLTVVGLFELGMYQYDSTMVLIHLNDARQLFRSGEEVTGLRIKLDNGELAPLVGQQLSEVLGPHYRARDWTQQHRNFFIALQDQKRILFIVLMMIVAVAAFNIVSTLIMMVTDKRADIAIMQTLGFSTSSITSIFIIQGTLLALVGTLTGAVIGVLLAWNVETLVAGVEHLMGFHFLAADIYPMTDLPAEVVWSDVGMIVGITILLGIVATIYPAWRASRVQPAEALRYE